MTEMQTIAPVTRSVLARCSPEIAFEVFTRETATWWPLETHALHPGEVADVVWEERIGGEVYEISTNGERSHWATITAWDPPSRLALAWHVNPEAPAPTDVEVTFTPEPGGTRIELEHRGWERLGADAEQVRANYDEGWEMVLGRYLAKLG